MQIALAAVAIILLFVFVGSADPTLGPRDYEPPRAEPWQIQDPWPELGRECKILVALTALDSPCDPTQVLLLCKSARGFSVDSHSWKFDGQICRYGVVTKWPPNVETKEVSNTPNGIGFACNPRKLK